MPALLRIIAALALLAFAAFCGFGFLASFEPSESPRWPWKVGYALFGAGFLAGAVRLFRPWRPRRTDAVR